MRASSQLIPSVVDSKNIKKINCESMMIGNENRFKTFQKAGKLSTLKPEGSIVAYSHKVTASSVMVQRAFQYVPRRVELRPKRVLERTVPKIQRDELLL
jgi:hypothetical protein